MSWRRTDDSRPRNNESLFRGLLSSVRRQDMALLKVNSIYWTLDDTSPLYDFSVQPVYNGYDWKLIDMKITTVGVVVNDADSCNVHIN